MRSNSRRVLAALVAMLAVGAVSAAPALASGKPFVETKPATSVGLTEATLNGVANPNGAETKYYFEYGETTSYGKKTAEATAGSGTSNLEESKAITGLSVGKTYHFRIVATNSNGTTDGADAVFGKPAAETTSATGTNGTGATLNGTVNPTGVETKYWFEYGTTEGTYTNKTAEASAGSGTSTLEESKAITGLTEGTTYYYRVVARNGRGTTDGSAVGFTSPQPEFTVVPNSFKGTFGSVNAEEGLEPVSYEKGTISGEMSSYHTWKNVTISLLEGHGGCFTEGGSRQGNTIFKALNGRLGYINKKAEEVGVMFEPFNTECSGFFGGSKYTGVIIAKITPVNTETRKFQVTFRIEAGNQDPLLFEGEKETTKNKKLEVWGYPARIETKGEIEFNTETKIRNG